MSDSPTVVRPQPPRLLTQFRRRLPTRRSLIWRSANVGAVFVLVALWLFFRRDGAAKAGSLSRPERCAPSVAGIHLPDPDRKWQKVASKAVKEATSLMDEDTQVLEAEAVLFQAIKRMKERRIGGPSHAAIRQVEQSPVYADVRAKAELYDSVSTVLAPENFSLCWEGDGAVMYINAPSGATWFEYRMVAHIDAPLAYCIAPQHERDLVQQYQPVFLEPHKAVIEGRHYSVVRTLSKIMAIYIEAVFENLRVSNKDFGFLTERVRSDFPTDGLVMPEKNWWSTRVNLDTKNLWMPRGGDSNGTILVSVSRVQVGVPIPENVVSFFFHGFASSILGNIRKGATLAMERGSPWNKRVKQDRDGFYAELTEVEKAAAKRRKTSVEDLPGPEVFDRPYRLRSVESSRQGAKH